MRTIRRQLLIGLLGSALACTLVAGLALYAKVSEEANELFDYQLRQLASTLPAQALKHTPGALDAPEDDIVVEAWDAGGTLLYAQPASLLLPRAASAGFSSSSAHGDHWRVYAEQRGERFVQVAQAVSARRGMVAALALRSILPFVLMLPVLAALIYFVVGKSLRPLGRIAEALGQRSPDMLHPLPLDGHPPEIVPMVSALNALLHELDHALERQRGFVADAAHELRSPLTALKLQLQLTERATGEQRNVAFVKLHARLDRCTHLVQQLLTAARHEAQLGMPDKDSVDLLALAQRGVGDRYAEASAAGIDLGVHSGAAPVHIQGNAADLDILLGNLIANALRHTPADGRIDVWSGVEGEAAALRVTDSGPGIAPEERTRVFDRFYRVNGTDSWGSGLGLSIVRDIAQAHGALVELGDNPEGHGLQVVVLFPSRVRAGQPVALLSSRRAPEAFNS